MRSIDPFVAHNKSFVLYANTIYLQKVSLYNNSFKYHLLNYFVFICIFKMYKFVAKCKLKKIDE